MKKWILGILISLSSAWCWAGAVNFEASLSHNMVEVGQRFQITFSLNNQGGNFRPPTFENLRILSGPNPASSTRIINGSVSQNMSYSYILVAEQTGKFTIGSASIEVSGETYKTKPLQIEVVKSSQNGANAQNQRQRERKESGDELSQYVFIRAVADKNSAYVGEKITVTYKLYTQLRLSNPQMESMPSLTGFWHQELRSIFKDDIQFKQEQFNGQIFNVAEIQQNVLYPQRSGDLVIDPLSLKFLATVQRKRARNMYEQMFGSYERKEVIASSKPINIKVKALPLKNKPADFSGAVGNFNAVLEANKNSLKSNEAIDVKLTIEGTGNLPLVAAPQLNFPPDFEVYDPETENRYKTGYNGSTGKKEFKYLVIPRHTGSYELEPFTFSYFDLASQRYKTISTDALTFEVARGADEENVVYQGKRKEDVELLKTDIHYIHLNNLSLINVDERFYGSTSFFLILVFILLLAIALGLIAKKQRAKHGDQVGLRKSKANKLAKKRLAKAKKHLDAQENALFYEEISEALFGYYADKYNISRAELSQEKIVETLAHDGLSELAEELKGSLEAAEMARFAPSAAIAPAKLYEDAINLIQKTENRNA